MTRGGAARGAVRKIAVLRANALGDFIFTLPALEALARRYPRAELVLLGLPWHHKFLSGRPGPVSRVEVVPPGGGVRPTLPGEAEEPGALERFFERMRAERFDLAVQLHGGGRHSNPFTRRLGARLTVGSRAEDAEPLDRWIPYRYWHHEVLRYLEVAALAGAEPVRLEPRVAVTEADLAEAYRVVPESDRPLVALHPGATDPRRRWPPERFSEVGDALAGAGAQLVVTGTGGEGELVERVLAAMSAPAVGLCDRLTLGGLTGLLSRCRLLVSNDTGPHHLAAAVGTATVGLYWCGNLINAGPLTRARHRPIIGWRLECPTCGRNCLEVECGHRDSFLSDLPASAVIAEALDLLESEGNAEQGAAPVPVREGGGAAGTAGGRRNRENGSAP